MVSQKVDSAFEKVKSTNSQKLYSLVEGQTAIVELVPDGSKVKKGQRVCLLDTSMLEDQLFNQQIATTTAAANFEIQLTRETAEIAVVEYADGNFNMEIMEIEGNIKIAAAELALAEDRLAALKAAAAQPKLETKIVEVALLRARFALEKCKAGKRSCLSTRKERKSRNCNRRSRKPVPTS